MSDPGTALVAPADGRLRGDHLAATVTGVAIVTHLGFGASARLAAKGQRLVVFGLSGAHLGQTTDDKANAIPPVIGTLIVDGSRRELPVPESDDGLSPVYYLASVPATAHDVDVELAASGLAQSFSLTAGARVGTQPSVLYRDRSAWQPVDQVNGEQVLATPDPADGLPGATLPVRVHDVYLAWFGPDSAADVPASPNQAWLVVDASSQDDSQIGSRYLHYLSGLTASQVTLALPSGQMITSQLLNPGTHENGTGVFDGIYDFPVPADLTTAALTIAPGNLQVTVAWSGSTPVTVAARGHADFPISFPAPYQPPPPVAPIQPDSQQAAASAAPNQHSGSGGLGAGIAAVGVVLLLGAWWVLARRRHLAHPAVAATVAGTIVTNQPSPRPPPDRRQVRATAGVGIRQASTPDSARQSQPDLTRTDARVSVPGPQSWSTGTTGPPASPPRPSTPRSPTPAPPATRPAPPAHPLGNIVPQPATSVRPPPPVLTPIPSEPPAPALGMLYFRVLGPYRVLGWPEDDGRSIPIIDLATYLALHPDRPYTAEELRDPLSVGKARALSADTVRTYASTLRRTVGIHHLPDAGRRGYALADFGSDWLDFVQASEAAVEADTPPKTAQALTQALALVRGAPFSDLPATGFAWVATELIVSPIEVSVIKAAERLVDLALAAGDWPLAIWAADRGLGVSPTAQDLNAKALRAAAISGHADRLAQACRDVTRRYTAADDQVPAELAQLRDQLRPSP